MNDITCKCGHPKKCHFSIENYGPRGSCHLTKSGRIINTKVISEYVDDCSEYVPDNLAHIEWLAKQKGLV